MTTMEVALSTYLVFGQLIPAGQQEIVKHAGLQVIHSNGAVTLRLKEVARSESEADGAKDLAISYEDEFHPFKVVRHRKSWNDCDVVETWLEISHAETGPVRLVRADSFASQIPVTAKTVKVMSLAGKWAAEANVRESEVAPGQIVQLLSRAGTRDAWESNAAMMVSFDVDADEEKGRVLGLALEWTGTTERRVRRNWDGKVTEVFAGIDMTTGPYVLDSGAIFTTPKAVMVWSDHGRGEVSRQFHRWARRHLMPHGTDLRSVLINSWEGSYFSFTEQTLLDMMDGVKELGGEMFVIDDGWFGSGKFARDNKNKDKTGLGDWHVNPEKLPRGLGFIADEAAKRGLEFGLWVEPEMVNTRSWLAQAHPDWLLREEGRPLVLGRGGTQTVLDMANPAVRDNLFEQLDKVYLGIPHLAYIKWDSNQNIVNPGSAYLPADRQPNLWYDYTVGLYSLLARFQAARPDVRVQACASGGGHMDFGFLRYADEFWTSDNTDPYSRLFIQWGASQFYPACAMACHVTASPNHQTKRETPLKYRFDVAMTGRLGFELHPKNMTPDEIAFAKAAVADYKRIRPVVQQGDLYRIVSPYAKKMAALMYVDEAKSHAALFALGLKDDIVAEETLFPRHIDPAALYVVKEINLGAKPHADLSSDAVPGRDLMEKGIRVRLSGPFDSAVFELTRLSSLPPLCRR